MSIKWADSNHKEAMEDAFPGTERFYIDPRQKVYPPLAGHDLAFTLHTSGDNRSGSHYLSGGNAYYMLDMPSKFVLSIELKPNFAFDVASNQNIFGWYIDATHRLIFTYNFGWDMFMFGFQNGGPAARYLYSRQFDNGTSHEDISQWMRWDIIFDSTTGDTTGSKLYYNRTLEDEAWSGNIDAKTSKFPLFELRSYAGTEGDYKINFVRLFSDITTDDVADDHKDIEEEEIYWPLNGYEAGQTRCNITRFVSRFATQKNIDGANTLDLLLRSNGGEFADEQYSAFAPAAESYNGLTTQRYLQHRVPVIAEHWDSNDFETFFVGRVNDNFFKRSSQVGNISMINITAEDMVSDIGREVKRKARSYEDYDICKPTGEATSLLHTIVRLATQKDIYNFLANSSFENATIGHSWLVSGTGATLSRVGGGLQGSYQGDLVYGSAVMAAYQTVLFTGTKKLNVGETWNFALYLKSASACSYTIRLEERDSTSQNGITTTTYKLAGAEGWVKWEVAHTITDTDSDRLRVSVYCDDNVTLSLDCAMLVQNDVAYDWFVLNNNDGAAGVESADDADSAAYDTIGFDTDAAAITHPWAIVEEGVPIWKYVKELGVASLARYCGVDSNGTFVFKPRIDEPADPSSLLTITAVKGLHSQLQLEQANKIIVHGDKIIKQDLHSYLWASATSYAFDYWAYSKYIKILDGAQWPDPSTYGEFWALYKAMTPEGPYTPPSEKITGVIGAKSIRTSIQSTDINGVRRKDLTLTIFDTTSRIDSARILLTNSTGETRLLTNFTIWGYSIIRLTGKDGFIHDGFVDYESIRKNGEMKLEIHNNFICLKSQVEKIAEYHWKFSRGTKHLYSLSFTGTRHYFEPGEWYTLNLNITTVGIDELMDMKCRCVDVSIERSADGHGMTKVVLEEVIENWTFDSNSVARFIASGNLDKLPTKEKMIVGASDYDGVADYYCDGTADEVEINKAIVHMGGRSGGIVELSEGTFKITTTSVVLKSNVLWQGRGANTIIEKNGNFYAVKAEGTSATYLENIIMRNLKITANASDTNDIELVHFKYVKDSILSELNVEDGYGDGLVLEQTLRVMVAACLIAGNVIGCKLLTDESTEMLDRNDCESTTGPALTGENPTTSDLTAARSTTEVYAGTYSFKLMDTSIPNAGYYYFTDNTNTNDMHGTTVRKTYRLKMQCFIPLADYIVGIDIRGRWYHDGAWETVLFYSLDPVAAERGYWFEIQVTGKAPENATGFYLEIILMSGVAANKFIYIDDVYLYEYDRENNGYMIHGCRIKENTAQGLYIASDGAQIRDNVIDNNKGVGLELYGNKNVISNNVCTDNGNLIELADCEDSTDPYITGDGSSESNASVARDSGQAYKGTYSSKLTITATASEGIGRLTDDAATDDLHELIAGLTYKLTAWVYVPSTGGPAAAEVKLRFSYYDSAAWTDVEAVATGQDAWEKLDCGEVTIPPTATGIKAERLIEDTASDGEYCYFDNFRLQPIGIHNEHEQNFKDSGTDTHLA